MSISLKNTANYTKNFIVLCLLILAISCSETSISNKEADKDWPVYLGGNSSMQYSSLKQITKENIQNLEVAWTFSTGDASKDGKTQIQCNPIIVNGVMYGSSPKLKIFAIDAASGESKWIFDPNAKVNFAMNVNRGVTFFENKGKQSIFFTAGPELYCLDAKTGLLNEAFGNKGKISLKTGLGEAAQELYVVSTSPGIIYKDKLIIGTRVSENADAAPGFIQAFNAITGELEWTFHTIPQPGELGYETWPEEAYSNVGGANTWAGMSLDEERGIVYAPTGSAAFDFYGGNRKGENLFANCILALDAATGKRIWHFQTIHHDIWDRDIPAPPNLLTINHNGAKKDVVVTATKTGFVFVLDRETGEPVFGVEEKPVPVSNLNGEASWETQPFPVSPPPFTRQKFTDVEITNLSVSANSFVKAKLDSLRTGQQFMPPSKQGSIVFPGFDGGAGWGGNAFDPKSGLLVINAKEIPCIITMEKTQTENSNSVDLGKVSYLNTCAMCHGKELEGNPSVNYPALTNLSEKYQMKEVIQIIENGKGGLMPGFPQLKDNEKKALVNFLYGIENEQIDPHEYGKDANKRKLPYTHTGYNRFYDQEGYPAVKPPWGTLTAIDLNKGSIKWQVPLGEYEELRLRGIPKTGMVNYGGPTVTASGLVFIAATKDEYFRAFDLETGEEIWKYKLPAAGYATPSVYEVNGKQYIVIACGGGKANTKSGDKYLSFALSD
ncbi:MAG: pyrrolo-quinoline quinone [Thalassobius sp.]|nr:pyrrolo-quinoline quinone [Thalassovita sp.]